MKPWIAVCVAGLLSLFALGCEKESAEPTEPSPFEHSTVVVTSGRESVHPVSCMGYINKYENGRGVLYADGRGYRALKDEDLQHPAFPTLRLKKTVSAKTTETISAITEEVMILTPDREMLDPDATFAKLSELADGAYLIVFHETTDTRGGDESIMDYTIRGSSCVFKLIVE